MNRTTALRLLGAACVAAAVTVVTVHHNQTTERKV
jgi:hypothetical protein